jgi:ubiquinone/menaquinone biosynthesis C-methylase UbiE
MNIDTLNRDFYERQNIVAEYTYTENTSLWPEEEVIFERYEGHIKSKAVLDIGCGGGRTAIALRKFTSDYVGIDFSAKMIESCQEKHPNLQFIHCDASDLSQFGDLSFDFAIFSFNGMDCMSQEKRIGALREIYRVIKPGGVFAFSSHNLDDRAIVTGFDRHDIKSPKSIYRNARNLISYFKVRKYQVFSDTYRILSDPLAGFGHLTYYIRTKDQVKQLEDIGFTQIEILNREAKFISANGVDQDSHWLHYVCRKPAS